MCQPSGAIRFGNLNDEAGPVGAQGSSAKMRCEKWANATFSAASSSRSWAAIRRAFAVARPFAPRERQPQQQRRRQRALVAFEQGDIARRDAEILGHGLLGEAQFAAQTPQPAPDAIKVPPHAAPPASRPFLI